MTQEKLTEMWDIDSKMWDKAWLAELAVHYFRLLPVAVQHIPVID